MPKSPPIAAFAGIGAAVVVLAGAFAYTGGWLTPSRLTPAKIVDALAPPGGPALGHRRNHSKGVCFTGSFAANGKGAELSKASVFAQGEYPVIGRFNLATSNAELPDGSGKVRGLGLAIKTPDGREWRMAMLGAPFFPVATPQDFYAMLQATTSKDPQAVPAFAGSHPAFAKFGGWAQSNPILESYAEQRFNSLNSFLFTDASGNDSAVRWSLIPEAEAKPVAAEDAAKAAPDFLETEIADRVAKAPARFKMVVTVANTGDPTADPTQVWPDDRRTVEVGTVTAQTIIPEANGPCRDINYDPTVLPEGIKTSDDPFPAARSAAYAVSFDRRMAEARDYPKSEGDK